MNTIILIDTDISFKDRLDKKLKVDMIADKYRFHLLCPDTTFDQKSSLVTACVQSVQQVVENEANVIAIFVDVVIVEGGRQRDSTGIDIAVALREVFPKMPLYNITGKYSDEESDVEIIAKATLEDVDGVLIKSFLEGKAFSAERLQTIIDKGVMKRSRCSYKGGYQSRPLTRRSVEEAYDVATPRVKSQIQEIGPNEFWALIDMLLPHSQGVISYMHPGRSGAFVFRVKAKVKEPGQTATSPKSWILKISNNLESLEREVQNYKELLRTPLHRASYPKLAESGLVKYGAVAGFAIELEEGGTSLRESFRHLSQLDLRSVTHGICEFIDKTYGDGERRYCQVWKAYFQIQDLAESLLTTLEDHRQVFEEVARSEYQRIYSFVETKGVVLRALTDYESEAELRTIHGDFNAGNLLIDRNKQLVFIDFSSRGKNHAAKDVAKLERDVIFRVFDGMSPNFYDWSRLDKWRRFSTINKSGKVFDPVSVDGVDDDLGNALTFLVTNRVELKKRIPGLTEKEYLAALAHYSFKALCHPELSIHKKVFALEYISNIFDSF